MLGFNNEDERLAWTYAEQMINSARVRMGKAEAALDRFTEGLELNRQRCARRGIGESDAEIRWGEMAPAKKALAEMNFFVSQAVMYYNAAAAYYSRAAYLRDRGAARDRGSAAA